MIERKITDLEQFALEQICRPYQTMVPVWDKITLRSLPCSLDTLTEMLQEKTEWSRLVLNRIQRIGFYFPSYIQHPLVDLIQSSIITMPFCLRCGTEKKKGFYEAGCSVWGKYYKRHLWNKMLIDKSIK